jgi:LEA14-like dessication related protein
MSSRISHPVRRVLLAITLIAGLGSGCAHKLPSAGFDGFAVKQLKPKLAQGAPLRVQSMSMDLQFDFVVRNPTGGPITVPEHEFKLQLGDAYTTTRRIPKQTVAASSVLRLEYPLHLDLDLESDRGLKALLGSDVPYAFSAEANLDLPEMVGQQPGSKDTQMTGALRGALALAGVQDDKLVLKHEGKLRLPLPPAFEKSTTAPTAQFLGPNGAAAGGKDVAAELQAVRQQLAPFVTSLDRVMTARLTNQLDSRTLMKLLVGDAWADRALTALRIAQIPVAAGAIALPNVPATPLDAMKSLEPGLGDHWSRFQTAWNGFDPKNYSGTLVVPTALPQGVRIALPVRIRNPNRFPIKLPGFQIAAFGGNRGMQLASLQAVPQDAQGKTPEEQMAEPFELAASTATDLMLVSELSWEQFGGLLQGMRGNLPPVKLKGQVMVDLGVGQVTIPVDVSP